MNPAIDHFNQQTGERTHATIPVDLDLARVYAHKERKFRLAGQPQTYTCIYAYRNNSAQVCVHGEAFNAAIVANVKDVVWV
jgi:hypothetical protein